MADIFISYAREDQDFVRRLHRALTEDSRDVWVDWEGIAPSAEWMEEIRTAIEGADAFVLVLSPDSLASSVCKEEVDHAAKQNKRLIPIVRCEVDAASVPVASRKFNWIYFRKLDDFEQAFELLIQALDTELDWVRDHTRLLVRAREWLTRARGKSFVLRGDDLKEAEKWLAQGADKEPHPTAVQTQYILASRKAATRLERIILTSVSFGLIVAVSLAALAWYQRNEKEQQRQIALAQKLTVQANSIMDSELDLALLLSVEANRIRVQLEQGDADDNEVRGTQIKSSLLNALEFSPHITTFMRGHHSAVRSVSFSPDGRTLASSGLDGSIILWDVASRQRRDTLLTGHKGSVDIVEFSPDGASLAAVLCIESHSKYGGVCKAEIRLWDATTFDPLGSPMQGHNWSSGSSLAFSPDGRILALGGGWKDNTILLLDLATRHWLGAPLRGHRGGVRSVEFSPDGQTLASSGLDGSIILWDVKNHELMTRLTSKGRRPIWSIAFDPSGKKLASGGGDGNVVLWDLATYKAHPLPTTHTGEVRSVVFSIDGGTLVSGSRDNALIMWDVATGQQVGNPLNGHSDDVFSVAFSPDGRTLASGGVDKAVILWNAVNTQPLGTSLVGHAGSVTSVAFSPDNSTLASGSEDHTIRLWDTTTRQPHAQPLYGHSDSVTSIAFSPDGATLASASEDQTIRLWNIATQQLTRQPLRGHIGGVTAVALSPDGLTMASGGRDPNSVIRLWDIQAGRMIGAPLIGHKAFVKRLAFSPDSQKLFSSDRDGTIIVWDLVTFQPIGLPLPGSGRTAFDVAFGSDGRTVASLKLGGIYLFDLETRERAGEPLLDHGPLASVAAFSIDGQTLASGTLNKSGNVLPTILLWDSSARKSIGWPLTGHTKTVTALAFSSNSHLLASGSDDKTVIIWDLSVASWKERACRIANRELSADEWEEYLVGETPNPTCGNR